MVSVGSLHTAMGVAIQPILSSSCPTTSVPGSPDNTDSLSKIISAPEFPDNNGQRTTPATGNETTATPRSQNQAMSTPAPPQPTSSPNLIGPSCVPTLTLSTSVPAPPEPTSAAHL